MNKSQQKNSNVSRRRVLGGLGLAAFMPLLPEVGLAQGAPAAGGAGAPAGRSQLPLKTPGLEHMGVVVPDVTVAAKFYGRVFNPEVHKEKEPPLRYYVTLGVGYLALGTRANESRTFFDHFCALVEDYDAKAMAEELTAKVCPPAASESFRIPTASASSF